MSRKQKMVMPEFKNAKTKAAWLKARRVDDSRAKQKNRDFAICYGTINNPPNARLYPAVVDEGSDLTSLRAAINYFEVSLAYKKQRLEYKHARDALNVCLLGEVEQLSSVDRGIAASLPHAELALAIMRLELQRAEPPSKPGHE